MGIEHSPAVLPPGLLSGGGELGELVRTSDALRRLGPVSDWPQSLKTAAQIMLTSRQPIWIGWGPELLYLYNDPYKSIIGGKHPWALGRPTAEVWSEIWDAIGPMLAHATSGQDGTYVEQQLLIMERSGYQEETYYTFSYTPISGDDGRPGGIFCANTDDTDRVISARRLALLRELAAAMAGAPGAAEALTAAAAALSSEPRDLPFALVYAETEGGAFTLAASAGFRADDASSSNEALRRADAWPLQQVLRDRNVALADVPAGSTLPHGAWDKAAQRVALIPVIGTQGTRPAIVVAGLNPFRKFDAVYRSFLDLVGSQIATGLSNATAHETERRRAEKLAEIDRAKTLFFSNVSHEFRTPLTLMLSPIEQLLAQIDDPNHRELLSLAERNGLRLQALVNSLLDLSRVEAGRLNFAAEPSDLAALTAELAGNFQSLFDAAGLSLTIDCAPLPLPVYVDREQWEKIIFNLLSNAYKFTLEGGVTVRVSPSQDNRSAILSIADTGVGMAPSDLSRLFQRFYRVEGQKGRSIEGTGIGLALVRELVTLHGGMISVESVVDCGTTFTLSLPFGSDHLAAEAIRLSVERTQSTASPLRAMLSSLHSLAGAPTGDVPAPAAADEDRPTILVVDDNPDMRGYLSRILSPSFNVCIAQSGRDALERIAARAPDLVLSDIMMPDLDGFGLIAAVRRDPVTASLPFILMSARAGEVARVEGIGAGADDYLTKPFSARELLARIEGSLKLARTRDEARAQAVQTAEQIARQAEELNEAHRLARVGSWTWNAARDETQGSGELFRIFGLDPARGAFPKFADQRGTLFPTESWETVHAAVEHALATGEGYQLDLPAVRGGQTIWISARAEAILAANGQVTGLKGTVQDITERRRAEEALRESEARFRQMADQAPVMIWVTEPDGRCTYLSASWYAFTGQSEAEGLGLGWTDAVHPNDKSIAKQQFLEANAKREQVKIEYRLRRYDGVYRWMLDAASPRQSSEGSFLGYIGSVIDITERKEAEQRQDLLIDELNHRVKNTLALVQSIASQTLRETPDPREFKSGFNARLAALSAAHNLLTRRTWQSAGFEEIVHAVLAPFGMGRAADNRIGIEGPPIDVAPEHAVSLTLALHELATNAVKYGALSSPHGTLHISWVIETGEGAPLIALAWHERQGPPVQRPKRHGFGTRLINATIEQLSGRLHLDYDPQGLSCRMTFPAGLTPSPLGGS